MSKHTTAAAQTSERWLMKQDQIFEKDEALSKLLRTWKLSAALPPRFQEGVWRRIVRAQEQTSPSLWHALAGRLEAAFSRPAFAASYVAVLLFIGLGAGYRQAGGETAQAESKWRTLYVQAVDPYQMPRN